jgi:hypothetical protein
LLENKRRTQADEEWIKTWYSCARGREAGAQTSSARVSSVAPRGLASHRAQEMKSVLLALLWAGVVAAKKAKKEEPAPIVEETWLIGSGIAATIIFAHTLLCKARMTILWRGPGGKAEKLGFPNWMGAKAQLEYDFRSSCASLPPDLLSYAAGRFRSTRSCVQCSSTRRSMPGRSLLPSESSRSRESRHRSRLPLPSSARSAMICPSPAQSALSLVDHDTAVVFVASGCLLLAAHLHGIGEELQQRVPILCAGCSRSIRSNGDDHVRDVQGVLQVKPIEAAAAAVRRRQRRRLIQTLVRQLGFLHVQR